MSEIAGVAAAYNGDPLREWNRLAEDAYHALEFNVTWDALIRRLTPGVRVLDAGGGPGRYSLALCRAGYQVTLFDLSVGHLDVARSEFAAQPEAVRGRLEAIVQGDIRDLSRWADGAFDAALCLGGPLSHLSQETDRRVAALELARVVRPGGLVFLTGVGKLAVMRWMLNYQSDELTADFFEEFLRGGNISGPTRTPWHFFRADELRALGESCGLETLEMLGCQGLSASLDDATNRLAAERPDLWQAWQRLVLQTASEPALVDTAEHILWIGKKRVD